MSAKVMENRKLGLDSYLHQLTKRDDIIGKDADLRAFLELDNVARTDVVLQVCIAVLLLALLLR